jgi:anaerobic dimethyl sulfoxide reductase subunit C (anchor subunit)
MLSREKYEWMVKYTPQTEWIEGKGILLWLAFFFIELGAGLYFVANIFDSWLGMLTGWLICLVIGGGTHLLYLGKPFRVYRAFLKPQTSWISRGMIFVALFALVGFIQLLSILLFQANPLALKIIIGIIAFLEVIYGGFAMSYVSALPIWNTPLIPAIYTVASIWGGTELLVGINLLTNHHVAEAESWGRILMLFFAFLLILYLFSIRYASNTSHEAIHRIVKGDLALLFYVGVVLIGLIFPFAIAGLSFTLGLGILNPAVVMIAIVCGSLGDLAMRYCIMKGALYTPLLPIRQT